MTTLQEQLRPTKPRRVRDLVEEAGINVQSWFVDRNGEPIDNNVYRNFQWSFGGKGEPVALCIWHEEIGWSCAPPILVGNTKAAQAELNALADRATESGVKSRLGIKVRRMRDFQNAIYDARAHALPVRAILLVGDRTAIADAADDSSKVKARALDPVPWYAHEFNPMTGEYKLVRGMEAPPVVTRDPFAGIVDPGLDPAFQDFVSTLDETEREAVIKARVGQGAFRQALIERWKGCSVTQCATHEVLVASHIKPWSKCLTPAERLGSANGLLLTPNLDKLFDRGLIAFDQKFRMLLSPKLRRGSHVPLSVDANRRLASSGAADDLLPFLAWHAENIFLA